MRRRIWIGWEKHRRNQSCSGAFDARLFEIEFGGTQLSRYWRSARETLSIIRKEDPDEIYCQNPSIVLTLLCIVVGQLRGVPIIVDAHNAALLPLQDGSWVRRRIARIWIQFAHAVIVTNRNLAQLVEASGGVAVVLPDPLPEILQPASDSHSKFHAPEPVKVLFICSWADDEPYEEVIGAAGLLPDNFSVAISGNYKKVNLRATDSALNDVTLLGYLSDADFDRVLWESDIILDLTDREDCLLCGAYEAVACGKPMVLSDTAALRQYFGSSAEYTDNTATSIAACIRTVAENYESFRANVDTAKDRIDANWNTLFAEARGAIAARLE